MKSYAVKVQNNKAEIYDAKTGVLQRYLGHSVKSAQVNGELIQLTNSNGTVEISSAANGVRQRTI